MTNRNVAEEDILIDDGGLDTYSTIYRCKEAFPNKRFIVCTQQKYFKRTGYLISKLGMNGYCMGIDKHQYKKEIYEKFRDFFASDKAWIECNITKPEPVYSLENFQLSNVFILKPNFLLHLKNICGSILHKDNCTP